MKGSSHRGPSRSPENGTTLSSLRRLLLFILLLGMLGTAAELLLTSHTEDLAQWAPLLLIFSAFLVLGWHAADRRGRSLRVFRWVMVLFMVSGIAGMVLHYQGKAAFQKEMDPSLSGMALFQKAIRTLSPPALAPGVMIQLGLLGLAYAYRSSAQEGANPDSDNKSTGA